MALVKVKRHLRNEEDNVDVTEINGDVVVNGSLKQSSPGFQLTNVPFKSFEGLYVEVLFGRIQQLNQSLHVIFSVKIQNTTTTEKIGYSLLSNNFTLPTEIASKIIDFRGYRMSQSAIEGTVVAHGSAWASRDSGSSFSRKTGDSVILLMNANVANQGYVVFGSSSGIKVEAGGATYIEGRIELDLL